MNVYSKYVNSKCRDSLDKLHKFLIGQWWSRTSEWVQQDRFILLINWMIGNCRTIQEKLCYKNMIYSSIFGVAWSTWDKFIYSIIVHICIFDIYTLCIKWICVCLWIELYFTFNYYLQMLNIRCIWLSSWCKYCYVL